LSRVEKLRKDVQPVSMEGEQIIDATSGMLHVRRMGKDNQARSGLVVVSDRRVILFSKKLGGYDVQDFAFGLLSGVDHKKGMMFGNLTFAAAGTSSHVTQVPKDNVERIAQLVRQKMAAAHSHGSNAEPVQQVDTADQIRKLAALRDERLITPNEFEAKKKHLLGL